MSQYSETTFKDNGDPIMLNADGSRSVFCDIDEGPDDPEPADATALVQLPPPVRAARVMNVAKVAIELRELVEKSSGIVAVLNPDGRAEAHRAGMTLKNARIAIEKTSKAAREDATAFSKAIISTENHLTGIVSPEEKRIFALRDGYDEKVAAEKAEAERVAAEILASRRALIANIVNLPAQAAGKSSLEIFGMLKQLAERDVMTEGFGDLADEALAAVNAAGAKLNELYDSTLAAEQAKAKREADEAIERARVERQAEENRKEAARLEALRVEAEAAEAERQRRAAAEETERARVATDKQRQLDAEKDAFAARVAAFEAEQQRAREAAELERHHAEALAFDLVFNAERDEKAHQAVLAVADAAEAAARQATAESVTAAQEAASLADLPVELVGESSIDNEREHLVSSLRTAVWDLMGMIDADAVRGHVNDAVADFALVESK